jgi:uncharacterized ion transporter superfamily protein YfcC
MTQPSTDVLPQSDQPRPSRCPTAYTIPFVLVVIMAAVTSIIPAGAYRRAPNCVLDKDVPVPRTYAPVVAAPLSDFAGVSCDLAVTAFQTAIGITNLVAPPYGVGVGGLAIARVPYNTWLRYVWSLLATLSLMSMALPSAAVMA